MTSSTLMPALSPEQAALVRGNERVDYILREQRYIIQNPDYFPFSMDAVLLADFAPLNKRIHRIMDFCSGGGIIPLLLSAKTQAEIKAIEIQEPIAEMARRSVQLNGLDEQIQIITGDIRQLTKPIKEFDLITCNPPYFKLDSSHRLHKNNCHAIARHEIQLTLEEWIEKAALLLKDKGKLVIVYRPNRLDDLLEALLVHHFAVNRLKFIYPKPDQRANGVLVEAIYRGGRQGIKVEPPIIVHQLDNSYSPQMERIYYG